MTVQQAIVKITNYLVKKVMIRFGAKAEMILCTEESALMSYLVALVITHILAVRVPIFLSFLQKQGQKQSMDLKALMVI